MKKTYLSVLAVLFSILIAGVFSCKSEAKKEESMSDNSGKICAAYIATWGVYDPVTNRHGIGLLVILPEICLQI